MPISPLVFAVATVAAAPALPMEVLVPAYFFPKVWSAQENRWDELTELAKSGVKVTAIMNVESGHATAVEPNYQQAVAAFKSAGGHVLAYVSTCWGIDRCVGGVPATQRPSDVLREIANYKAWYPNTFEGVFLDEMSTDLSVIDYYREISQSLRDEPDTNNWTIVGNPGTTLPQAFLPLVDIAVTFEGSEKMYRARTDASFAEPPPPMDLEDYDPASQAHMIYNVYSVDAMKAVVDLAAGRNARYLYVTDQHHDPAIEGFEEPSVDPIDDNNPWDDLPSYWGELFEKVQR